MSRLPSDRGAVQAPARPTRPRGHDRLTERQRRFLLELLAHPTRNAARAYMRAGYRVRDARVASAAASRMLSKASVRREYQRLLDELTAPLQDRAAALVAHWFSVAFANITDVITWNSAGQVRLLPLEQMNAGIRAVVSRLVVGPGGEVRVELGGRDAATKGLLAHLGMCQGRSAPGGR